MYVGWMDFVDLCCKFGLRFVLDFLIGYLLCLFALLGVVRFCLYWLSMLGFLYLFWI